MPLRTRLDGRSDTNCELTICDKDGNEIATVAAVSSKVELAIETTDGAYIVKPNGFSSKKD